MEKLFVKVSEYYIKLMEDGTLKEGDRMPSIRDCAKNLGVSRTTAENAYMMMAEDGYIYSKEKSGFFVTHLAMQQKAHEKKAKVKSAGQAIIKYDFATVGEDHSAASLSLWTRYIKSAMRQEESLLTYPMFQGEDELRQEIADFVRTRRNIICAKEDIVIGAGFQSLLHILLPMLREKYHTASVPTQSFKESAQVLRNQGFEVSYRNKAADIIYVAPAYMTNYGTVMSLKRRYELVEHGKNGHFIIEDDYQNEFIFSSMATPSLYALSGGKGVAYLGSFSRVLLPSVRVSFMIMPAELRKVYSQVGADYNQTASKVEQLALASFLRDGQLLRHMRKLHRVYETKREYMEELLQKYIPSYCEIKAGEGGMEYVIRLGDDTIDEKALLKQLEKALVKVKISHYKDARVELVLSCGAIERDLMEEGIKAISVAIASLH